MSEIPSDTLTKILALRAENGLEATAEALEADLAKSKAKWTLIDTPRYRQAGRSPLFVSGKYLTSYKVCPATGEVDAVAAAKVGSVAEPKPQKAAPVAGKIDEMAFYKVLHAKGFSIKMSQNLLTGELETTVPAAIENLNLTFGAAPQNAQGIYVTQTSPQIQVAMSLEKFLEISGIRP
jgi:hypothetical protein